MIIFAAYGICFVFVRFYEATVEGRSLRSSGVGLQEEEEEESGEEEPEEGKDYSWKKTIMIGPSYQVAKNTQYRTLFFTWVADSCLFKCLASCCILYKAGDTISVKRHHYSYKLMVT